MGLDARLFASIQLQTGATDLPDTSGVDRFEKLTGYGMEGLNGGYLRDMSVNIEDWRSMPHLHDMVCRIAGRNENNTDIVLTADHLEEIVGNLAMVAAFPNRGRELMPWPQNKDCGWDHAGEMMKAFIVASRLNYHGWTVYYRADW